MECNKNIPELIERYLEESGKTSHWVTVNEIRTYFHLDETASPAISGFLRRIYIETFPSFPFRVERIETVALCAKSQRRNVKRYLVIRRSEARIKSRSDINDWRTSAHSQEMFTDYDAINHFDRVLHQKLTKIGVKHPQEK